MNIKEQKAEWFVIHDGKHYGPVSLNDLRDEAKRGRLHPHKDMLWKNGLTSWVPAETLEQMAASPAAIAAKKPQFVTYQVEDSSKRSVLLSFLLWLLIGILLLGTTFFVLMIALPKEHRLRIKLHEATGRVEAIWQKQ
jgi:hypothetical protein